MKQKLTDGQMHLLKLCAKGQQCPEGWAPVSALVFKLVETIPTELVELQQTKDGRGRARLTTDGQDLLDALAWL